MNKLNPEQILVPSQQRVSAILAHYHLPLTRFEPASHGIENLTLLVWSRRKEYVLRVYPQGRKSDADILLELDFMSHLRDHGLPLPAILMSADEQPLVVCEFDHTTWQSVLMEHAPGAHPEAYTPALLDHMAPLQARMHLLGEQYAKTRHIASGRATLRGTSLTDELLKQTTLESALRAFLERVSAFVVELPDTLPKGLSHFDYDIENILTQHDRVTAILDFGDAECMPLVVCLGYTLWDVLFEQGGSAASAARYVQQYQGARPLQPREKELLREIILFRHYIITTVLIQFGDFNQNDLDKALQQEQDIRSLELKC